MTIDEAFAATAREQFVPPQLRGQAGFDIPLPIGHGQTISQPTTVRRMLEWLAVEPGQTVLDVGSGSGWTTALLSRLVGSTGKVYAVERVPELVRFGRENCARLGLTNVSFHRADRQLGLPAQAPFHRILVSAAARELPEALLEQLKTGGRLVVPVRSEIVVVTKTSAAAYDTEIHPGYVFVDLK